MLQKIFSVFIFLTIGFSSVAQAQVDKDDLQKQREKLKNEISQTEKTLNETKKTAKVNIGQLSLINKKLDLQGNVIENISGEIKNLNDNIFLSQLEINKMKRVLDTLKEEYSKSMVYAYKNRSNYDFLNFIFSANNFNDAIKRIAYLKSYRNYREMQADNIIKTQAMLEDKIAVLSGNKVRKNVVLKEQGNELSKLEKQKNEKAEIVAQLNGRQKELTAQVNAKRKQDLKIRDAITVMIKREIALAKAEAAKKEKERLAALKKENAVAEKENKVPDNKTVTKAPASETVKKEPAKASNVLVSSAADIALNESFVKNKGRLPWPVDGFLIYHFGVNKYLGRTDYYSYGVTIGAKVGAPVKAVFDGEVTQVNFINDMKVVNIRHGKYFTVYSNLGSSTVTKGQKVTTGQTIGTTGINDDGDAGQIDFILMDDNVDAINPALWLRK